MSSQSPRWISQCWIFFSCRFTILSWHDTIPTFSPTRCATLLIFARLCTVYPPLSSCRTLWPTFHGLWLDHLHHLVRIFWNLEQNVYKPDWYKCHSSKRLALHIVVVYKLNYNHILHNWPVCEIEGTCIEMDKVLLQTHHTNEKSLYQIPYILCQALNGTTICIGKKEDKYPAWWLFVRSWAEWEKGSGRWTNSIERLRTRELPCFFYI